MDAPAATIPSDVDATSKRLHVAPWLDAEHEAIGYPLRHPYVEMFATSRLGCTGVLLLRRLGLHLDVEPDGFVIDVEHEAAALGLGRRHWDRTWERLESYGHLLTLTSTHCALRRSVRPLGRYWVRRLPEQLQREHAEALVRWPLAGDRPF